MKYLASSLLLIMTATAFADDNEESESDRSNDCILVSSRLYIQAVTENYIYVESGSRKFLMTARRRCPGIDEGYNIRFEGSRRQVCSSHRPSLVYYNLTSRMPSCKIDSIRRVENWGEAHSLMVQGEQERVKERNERNNDEKKKRKQADKLAQEREEAKRRLQEQWEQESSNP